MQSAKQPEQLVNFEADDLPVDVFSLTSKGLTVESLTAGHGLPENAASSDLGGAGSCSPAGCACF